MKLVCLTRAYKMLLPLLPLPPPPPRCTSCPPSPAPSYRKGFSSQEVTYLRDNARRILTYTAGAAPAGLNQPEPDFEALVGGMGGGSRGRSGRHGRRRGSYHNQYGLTDSGKFRTEDLTLDSEQWAHQVGGLRYYYCLHCRCCHRCRHCHCRYCHPRLPLPLPCATAIRRSSLLFTRLSSLWEQLLFCRNHSFFARPMPRLRGGPLPPLATASAFSFHNRRTTGVVAAAAADTTKPLPLTPPLALLLRPRRPL